MADRIQRRRTAGWRMPEGAVYVGRPTKWGNPFTVGGWYITRTPLNPCPYPFRAELGGRDLACWCPLDQPCHADVLLEIANGAEVPRG